MKISQLIQLPYPPYRVTNWNDINHIVKLSDVTNTKYVHPCEQVRRWHQFNQCRRNAGRLFVRTCLLGRPYREQRGSIIVEFEYI